MFMRLPKFFYIAMMIMILGGCAPRSIVTSPSDQVFYQAERLFQQKSYDAAMDKYNEYLQNYPQGTMAPAALIKIGQIYMDSGKYESARNVFTHMIIKYPDSFLVPDARIGVLESFFSEGNYQEVVIQGEKVADKIVSRLHLIRFNMLMGDAFLEMDALTQAVSYYLKAYEYSSFSEKKNVNLKLNRLLKRTPPSEIKSLLDDIRNRRAKGYLMFQLAMIYLEENRNDEAYRMLSDIVNSYPDIEHAQQARDLLDKLSQLGRYQYSSIGCLLPLSGAYEYYGNKALKGIEFAMSRFGEKYDRVPTSIIIKDTRSDPYVAARAVEELYDDGVVGIIGPINTADTAAQEAQKKEIPIVTITGKVDITKIGDYVFRNFLTPEMQVKAIVAYAVNALNLRRFAILYPDEKYGYTFSDIFKNEVYSMGGIVVGSGIYSPNETDFAGNIHEFKSAMGIGPNTAKNEIRDYVEAIFIPDSAKKAGLIIPQLAFYDIADVQYLGTNLWHSESLIQLAGKFIQGAIVPEVFYDKSATRDVQDFVSRFTDFYGEKPGFIEALAYDTTMIMLEILRNKEIRFKSDFRDELMKVYNYKGLTGMTSFESTGEVRKTVYLLKVEGDRFIELKSAVDETLSE